MIGRIVLTMATLVVALGARTSLAQTLPYDHVHLAAPDPEQAVAWYRTHVNGEAGEWPERVRFGPVLLIWTKRARIVAEPRPLRGNQYAFIEDPNGVRIEVIQRPQF